MHRLLFPIKVKKRALLVQRSFSICFMPYFSIRLS